MIADSGLPGQTGGYLLEATETTLTSPAYLLESSVADGSVLTSSPLMIYFDLSTTVDLSQADIELVDNNTGMDVNYSYNFDPIANEVQIQPLQGLGTDDSYTAFIFDPTANNGNGPGYYPPYGGYAEVTFSIAGVDGNTSGLSDDTKETAQQLGVLTSGELTQVAGAIGSDPFVNQPGDQMDLYHFEITGSGNYALAAEAFAGRIGSALDPSLTLFKDVNGTLELVAGNNGSQNTTTTQPDVGPHHPLSDPLYTDPALFAGLTAGSYYIAVGSHSDYANPVIGQLPGQNGVFAENANGTDFLTDSANTGGTIGNYVLNLQVEAAPYAPHVVSATVSSGGGVSHGDIVGPPTSVDIHFSGPVNLGLLAFEAGQIGQPGTITPIFIENAQGTEYSLRLVNYDPSTYEAQFILLDRLSDGTYTLHISGENGVTDFAGNPVVGNTPGGDYVVSFTVADAPVLGATVKTTLGNDNVQNSQNLGVIFSSEIENTFVVQRAFSTNPSDTADYYEFQVLQTGNYTFSLRDTNLTGAFSPMLVDAEGDILARGSHGTLTILDMGPGTYYLLVNGWTAQTAGSAAYELVFSVGTAPENPTPLTIGPEPALRMQLVSNAPYQPPAPPVLSLPPTTGQGGGTVPISTTTTQVVSAGMAVQINSDSNAALMADLASGPVGVVRGPGFGDKGNGAVSQLNLPSSFIATASGDDSRDVAGGFFDDVGSTFDRVREMLRLATDMLFSTTATLDSQGDSNLPTPPTGEEDGFEMGTQGMLRSSDGDAPSGFALIAPDITGTNDNTQPPADRDTVWTSALGLVGALALRQWGRA